MPADSMKITIPANTDTEYLLIRGALKERGVKSLSSWARKHHFALTTTYAAARGTRRGAESRKIQKKLEETINAKAE
jgi:hypothetical protein